jgi:cell division septal protein FtsQ
MFANRTRLLLLMVIVVGGAFIYAIEFTDWHQLEAVTLDGEPMEDFSERLGLSTGQPLTGQPLAQAAANLLKSDSVVKVDVRYDLPHGLDFETNRFAPLCVLVDERSGRLFGVNFQGRLVPLRPDHDDWEHPVLTGLKAHGVFEPCNDERVGQLMPQLAKLSDNNSDLYRLIEEIDFSDFAFVRVQVAGLPYRLKLGTEDFYDQFTGFVRFLERYRPNLDSARQFDLRFAEMIIQENKRR